MHIFNSLKLFALWNFLNACILIVFEFSKSHTEQTTQNLNIYVLGVALIHGIYGIWFLKGSGSFHFARKSSWGRMGIAVIFISFLLLIHFQYSTFEILNRVLLISYLSINAVVFLASAILSLFNTSDQEENIKENKKPMEFEHYNRFVFATYMVGLSVWIFFHSAGFIDFFHLPTASQPADPSQGLFLKIFASLLLNLAYFNFIAVYFRIEALIEAGVRGGLATCVFVSVLVITKVVHPLVLLLPAVDLVSVVFILKNKISTRREPPARPY